MNPGKFLPSPSNNTSQVRFAQGDLERSSSVILETAKKAICIPSSIPTTAMNAKNKMTETIIGGGTDHFGDADHSFFGGGRRPFGSVLHSRDAA